MTLDTLHTNGQKGTLAMLTFKQSNGTFEIRPAGIKPCRGFLNTLLNIQPRVICVLQGHLIAQDSVKRSEEALLKPSIRSGLLARISATRSAVTISSSGCEKPRR